MAKVICVNELIDYLDENFNDPVLIKAFNNEDFANDFASGHLCLGTVDYYRNNYEEDGRGDKKDSIAVFPMVIGLTDEKGFRNVYATQTEILTAIIFCMMEYDHTPKSKKLLREYFQQKENLGSYLCIVRDRRSFIENIASITFERVLDGDAIVPIVDKTKYFADKVEYVEKPDSMGFQKQSIQKYMVQQEFRIAFNFKVAGFDSAKKGQIKSAFLFKINSKIDCQIFEISK